MAVAPEENLVTNPATFRTHPMIRLLIVDDHPIVREGMKVFFAEDDQIRVIAEATNEREAIEFAMLLKPDLILMDLKLPLLDGATVTQRILSEQPDTKILILTIDIDPAQIVQLVEVGIVGYLLKDIQPKRLVESIKNAVAGYPQFDPKALDILVKHKTRQGAAQNPIEQLTPRERQIMRKVVAGHTNGEIGKALSLSESTIKFHISNILQKLHLTNRVQLAAYVTQNLPYDRESTMDH